MNQNYITLILRRQNRALPRCMCSAQKSLRLCVQNEKTLISPELFFPSSLFHFSLMVYQPQNHSSSKLQTLSVVLLHLISGQASPILPQEYHSQFTTIILIQVRDISHVEYFNRLLSGLLELRLSFLASILHFVTSLLSLKHIPIHEFLSQTLLGRQQGIVQSFKTHQCIIHSFSQERFVTTCIVFISLRSIPIMHLMNI